MTVPPFFYGLENTMSQRLLPSDYSKLLKTKKNVKKPKSRGFFTLPEDIIGEQDIGDRKFLVFYFDSADDYDFVRKLLKRKGSKTRSHPDLNAEKLARLLRRAMKETLR